MKLTIKPHHKDDNYIGDWERVAFYTLAAYFRKRLLANPKQINFIFKVDTLKRLINFEEVSEGEKYAARYKHCFRDNDDPKKDTVIDQLFDLIVHTLNVSMELREIGRSTRFVPFVLVGISDDLKTYSIELSGGFRRLIIEYYELLIYNDALKAGLTDPGALEIFEMFDGPMIIPIDKRYEIAEMIEVFTPGINEINAKTLFRLCIEPVEEKGQIVALRIIEDLESEVSSA